MEHTPLPRQKKQLSSTIGRGAEHTAAHFLKAKGWQILQQNFRGLGFEIDLIAKVGDVLVGVEVKALPWQSRYLLSDYERLRCQYAKKRRCLMGLRRFAGRNRLSMTTLRWDIVVVKYKGREQQVHAHYIGA